MTQEELNNLKVGDCFIFSKYICKVVKIHKDAIHISYVGVFDHAITTDEFNITYDTSYLVNGRLCDSSVYDKALKILDTSIGAGKSIIASSSAIAKKED